MSANILEYPSYDEAEHCLDDREALERYRAEKAANPSALVTLNELHCGEHWKVKVYNSKAEKDEYFRKKIRRLLERFEKAALDFQKSR
jgi:hypothetical protein